MTVIRDAALADVPAIVRMGVRFATGEYARLLTVNEQALAILASHMIQNAACGAWVLECDGVVVGMLGMTTYPQAMSGETIATEMVWWMEPEARGGRGALRLLEHGKTWARAQGATRLQMIAPNTHVGAFYERLGFQLLEIHYQAPL